MPALFQCLQWKSLKSSQNNIKNVFFLKTFAPVLQLKQVRHTPGISTLVQMAQQFVLITLALLLLQTFSLKNLASLPKTLQKKQKAFLNKTKNGSIILCHNNAENTLEALPHIFANLQGRGYEFVKLSKLIYTENYTIDNNGRQKLNVNY